MTVVSLLQKAKARIYEEKNWTIQRLAVNVGGVQIHPTSEGACRWCALGAIISALPDADTMNSAVSVLNRVIGTRDPSENLEPIAYFNDTRAHSEVLAKFDEAIALSRKEAL